MRLLRLALVLTAATCALPAAAVSSPQNALDPGPLAPSARVGIFYYPWFATPQRDGHYAHWQQGGSLPPVDVASGFYPARGVYSSADALVVDAQMREIAAAGIGIVIASWWGRDSREDRRLPLLLAAARRHGLEVAGHLEPYGGRTVASTETDITYLRGLGITDFYVWASVGLPDAEWAELNRQLDGVRIFANTNLAGRAAAGGFDGLYTYDTLLFDGVLFPRLCTQARRLNLLCAPSVGPGYDARRATPDHRVKPRRHGRRYDAMWRGAVRAKADLVTITSYNEWHEGTQIEPARGNRSGYQSYDGAWGLRGRAAESAYLDRTAYWVQRLMRR
ncbi:MAG: alpha-mannosidase [Gaiellaceae bacterium]